MKFDQDSFTTCFFANQNSTLGSAVPLAMSFKMRFCCSRARPYIVLAFFVRIISGASLKHSRMGND